MLYGSAKGEISGNWGITSWPYSYVRNDKGTVSVLFPNTSWPHEVSGEGEGKLIASQNFCWMWCLLYDNATVFEEFEQKLCCSFPESSEKPCCLLHIQPKSLKDRHCGCYTKNTVFVLQYYPHADSNHKCLLLLCCKADDMIETVHDCKFYFISMHYRRSLALAGQPASMFLKTCLT